MINGQQIKSYQFVNFTINIYLSAASSLNSEEFIIDHQMAPCAQHTVNTTRNNIKFLLKMI
jgi:hypothetical protein